MGLIVKREEDEHEVIEGVEVIERSDVPGDLPENPVELVAGASAEDIAAGRAGDEAAAGDEDAADDKATAGNAPSAGGKGSGGDGGNGGSDGGHTGTPFDDPHHPARPRTGILIAALVIAVVIAAIGGYAFGSGAFGPSRGVDSATVTEDQLDSVIATYTYGGGEHSITVRDAIETQYSLEAAQNEDGTYNVPSSDGIVSIIRNQIMESEAASRGIEVSDDEMDAYAEQMLGSSDYETLASQYGLTEDQAKKIVRQNAIIQKLYDQVVPGGSSITTPMAPTEPEDGDTSTASAEYAQYIIDLAGDEWDSEAGTWASEDGPYYAALKDEKFTADSATYEQAMIAYYVAYQEYQTNYNEASATWIEFANGLFNDATVTLYGIYA